MEFKATKFRINDIEMNAVVAGEGLDVLLVHGFPDSTAVWRHQIPRWWQRAIAPLRLTCADSANRPRHQTLPTTRSTYS